MKDNDIEEVAGRLYWFTNLSKKKIGQVLGITGNVPIFPLLEGPCSYCGEEVFSHSKKESQQYLTSIVCDKCKAAHNVR